MKAVILAAGIGSRIRPLTDTGPKFFLPVGDVFLGELMIDNLMKVGIHEYVIVTGYYADKVKNFILEKYPHLSFQFVENHQYQATNTGYSLLLTRPFVEGDEFVKLDGDVYFEFEVLNRLLHSPSQNCLSVDSRIHLDKEEVKVITDHEGHILQVGKSIDSRLAHGESIGIEKVGRDAGAAFFSILAELMRDKNHHSDYYDDSYTTLVERGFEFSAIDISDLKWVEIDTHEDYARLKQMLKKE